jgi:hypothetical protein
MDRERFDALAKLVWAKASRRAALGGLLGTVVLGLAPDQAAAKPKPKDKRQRRRQRRQRKQGNNRGDQHPLDCPDAVIHCWPQCATGCCLDADPVGSLGPVGTCYSFPSCCPCDHPSQEYWDDLCNQTFPACGGLCTADDGLGPLIGCVRCHE